MTTPHAPTPQQVAALVRILRPHLPRIVAAQKAAAKERPA